MLPTRKSSLTIDAYLLLGTRQVSVMFEGNVMMLYPYGMPPMATGTVSFFITYSSMGATIVMESGSMRVLAMGAMPTVMCVVSEMLLIFIFSVYTSVMLSNVCFCAYMVALSGIVYILLLIVLCGDGVMVPLMTMGTFLPGSWV